VNGLSRKLLLCFCLCFCLTAAKAQYRIDHWTADDGLPQNSVYGIVQTKDGYLWLATFDGLARFDGARFTIFNKSNSPGIVNNRFTSLFETASGDLWAGTEESGAGRFHGGRFEHFGADAGAPRHVSWIEADAENGGAVIHGDSQAFHFSDGKFSPVDAGSNFWQAERISLIPNREIFCVFNSKIFPDCFIDGRWQSFLLAADLPQENILLAAQQVNFVWGAQEANGIVWLITADGRLARAENGRITRFFDERDGLPEVPLCFMTGSQLGLVARDAAGALWLVDLPSMQKELLLKKTSVPPPLEKAEISSTYQDNEGNLWFGTGRDGLFRARKQTITAYSEADGIADKNVYPIYEDRAGTIWIGTTGGLFKYENETFTSVKSTDNFQVNAIGEDAAGRILISNYGALYVQENNRFIPFERGKNLDVGYIYAIHADRENALWIGGSIGLRRFKDGVLTSFTTADGLAGNDVKVIIEARTGGLWIGTYDGLTRLENGQLTSWRETDGLPSRTVRSLYEDADGTLWIGSYDGGLARFKDGKFTRYNTKTGLPNDGAFQILEDDNRNFWISSNRGIYLVRKDELNEFADGKRATITSVSYGKSDGMLNAECNGGRSPAGIRARDGRLWFPTQDGVAVIDPREIKVNSQPPPVVIETVKIDNNNVEFSNNDVESDSEKSKIQNLKSKIQIEPSQQSFEIGYTALSFINSENLRFKYKLEGLDDDWIDAGTRRLAYFSHVPPGNYTFRVIAANSDGVWNEQGATLKIVVMPPYYRTWWFITLAVFALGIFAYLLFRRRDAQINLKHAAELAFSRRLIDSQEQERKRLAAELHDGLGQNLVVIKNRALLGMRKGDDRERVAKELDSISETATQAIEEVREITNNLRPQLLDRLGLTKAINAMLKKVSGVIEIESEIDSIDNIFSDVQEISVYRIVQESLNNVIKHSNASVARVVIKAAANTLLITVEDDGTGFDFEAAKSKSGFGLVGLKERTQLLNGEFAVDSKIGQGTKIRVKIPFQNSG
jgi:signal transduction histidine kinase/ligand-binding sensor domain-containing protein